MGKEKKGITRKMENPKSKSQIEVNSYVALSIKQVAQDYEEIGSIIVQLIKLLPQFDQGECKEHTKEYFDLIDYSFGGVPYVRRVCILCGGDKNVWEE